MSGYYKSYRKVGNSLAFSEKMHELCREIYETNVYKHIQKAKQGYHKEETITRQEPPKARNQENDQETAGLFGWLVS